MTFEEEINIGLEACAGDKAPGPNGFNFFIIRAPRGFLRNDFCGML